MKLLLITSIALVFVSLTTRAHQFSTAYMDVTQQENQPALLWKVELHDLVQAGLIEAPHSHQVSWQQVLDSEQKLQAYVLERLTFSSDAGDCQITTSSDSWMAQRVQQNYFLLLPMQLNCKSTEGWQITYKALFDSEQTHKLLLSWQLPGAKANAVLKDQQPSYPVFNAQ